MSIGSKLSNEVKAWGTLAIVVVVMTIILLKFQANSSVSCPDGYNVSSGVANLCVSTATDGVNVTARGLYTTLNTFITGLSEPKNWITIVIIAIIGFAVLMLFRSKQKG